MTWHQHIPWEWVRHAYRSFRKTFFTQPRPEGKYFRVESDEQWLTRVLGARSYAPNWEFSYNKKGEDLNLARVVYRDRDNYDIVWWQYHVRGWEVDSTERGSVSSSTSETAEDDDPGVWHLRCHFEPEATEYGSAHISGVGYDLNRGMRALADVLRESRVDFEEIHWENE